MSDVRRYPLYGDVDIVEEDLGWRGHHARTGHVTRLYANRASLESDLRHQRSDKLRWRP